MLKPNRTKRVYLSPTAIRRLQHLAGIDRRRRNAEVEWLIDEALRQRGIDPKTLRQSSGPVASEFDGHAACA